MNGPVSPLRRLAVASLLALLGGCTITQRVTPVPPDLDAEVCIIENPRVRSGFIREYQSALATRGYRYRMLPAEAQFQDCPVTSTYVANWQWDLALYMAYAEIRVYRDGQLVGEAIYDSTHGSGRLDKFIDAEPKIQEMVASLFPAR